MALTDVLSIAFVYIQETVQYHLIVYLTKVLLIVIFREVQQ